MANIYYILPQHSSSFQEFSAKRISLVCSSSFLWSCLPEFSLVSPSAHVNFLHSHPFSGKSTMSTTFCITSQDLLCCISPTQCDLIATSSCQQQSTVGIHHSFQTSLSFSQEARSCRKPRMEQGIIKKKQRVTIAQHTGWCFVLLFWVFLCPSQLSDTPLSLRVYFYHSYL